jgi:hypothetical protein
MPSFQMKSEALVARNARRPVATSIIRRISMDDFEIDKTAIT